MNLRHTKHGTNAGIGLVEIVISATILLLLAASMVEAVSRVGALGNSGNTDGKISLGIEDALRSITADLRASGFVAVGLKSYPHLFENGEPTNPDFALHAHEPAVENAEADEADFGTNREIVFVRPAFEEVAQDADGVNWDLVDDDGNDIGLPADLTIVKRYDFPVLDANGVAGFRPEEISYVLVTGADGQNELQRRVDGGSPQIVARGVERLVFDTSITDPVGVPIGAVRARLWLRLRDGEGMVHRQFAETVVRLQNGG